MTILPSEIKQINEWALAAGRQLQSSQTGFVHYFYGEVGASGYQTIPLLENALFSLALLRSHLVENAQEGIRLIKKLLSFQNRQEGNGKGNFPVYLHDYPDCHDPSLGLQLLAPFYWMIHHYGHVLGVDLRKQLEEAVHLIFDYSLAAHAAKPFPYFLSIRLFAAQWAFGKRWHGPNSHSNVCLGIASQQLEGWNSTKQLGHLLAGLQMVYPSLLNSPWEALWKRMEQTWHQQTGTYIGPCMREWQGQAEPQPNLYDLYAGYFSGQFSKRAAQIHPFHLHGALIQPAAERFSPSALPYKIEGLFHGERWETACKSLGAFTLLEKTEHLDLSVEKLFTPFRLIWGDLDQTHSFVCQGCGENVKVGYRTSGTEVELIFDLGENFCTEGREKDREIQFFVDYLSNARFFVGKNRSNTFNLGEVLEIVCNHVHMTLTLQLLEGEGTFMGHVMRGNRPSQADHKGEQRFQASDWAIVLRTTRRKGPCRLRAHITIKSG